MPAHACLPREVPIPPILLCPRGIGAMSHLVRHVLPPAPLGRAANITHASSTHNHQLYYSNDKSIPCVRREQIQLKTIKSEKMVQVSRRWRGVLSCVAVSPVGYRHASQRLIVEEAMNPVRLQIQTAGRHRGSGKMSVPEGETVRVWGGGVGGDHEGIQREPRQITRFYQPRQYHACLANKYARVDCGPAMQRCLLRLALKQRLCN